MKIKTIRKSIFETNSSSTHSISVADLTPEDINRKSYGFRKGTTLKIHGGQFGWEIEEYRDWETKASYCAVDNWCDQKRIALLTEVLKEVTGASDVEYLITTELEVSYIDHQSSGVSSILFENKETLKKFIFGSNSVLYTDNDNH